MRKNATIYHIVRWIKPHVRGVQSAIIVVPGRMDPEERGRSYVHHHRDNAGALADGRDMPGLRYLETVPYPA